MTGPEATLPEGAGLIEAAGQPVAGQSGPGSPAAVSGGAAAETDWTRAHPVNVRVSIPLGFARYYITIVCGRERRNELRLRDERRRHPLITAGNLAFFFALGSLVGLAALALLNLLTASLYGQG